MCIAALQYGILFPTGFTLIHLLVVLSTHPAQLGGGYPAVRNSLFIFPIEPADGANGPSVLPRPDAANTRFGNAADVITRNTVFPRTATSDPIGSCAPAYPNASQEGPDSWGGLTSFGASYFAPCPAVVPFCDGFVRTRSESVDHTVSTRLVTVDGTRLRVVPGAGEGQFGRTNRFEFIPTIRIPSVLPKVLQH